MTSQEAMGRLVWRFGFVLALAGSLSILGGTWLVAAHFQLNALPLRWSFGVAYLMGAAALGGACWLALTGWREGVFREYIDPAPFAAPLGVPVMAVVAFAAWPEVWDLHGGESILFGLALLASGVHVMRRALLRADSGTTEKTAP